LEVAMNARGMETKKKVVVLIEEKDLDFLNKMLAGQRELTLGELIGVVVSQFVEKSTIVVDAK
jgi:hypothetical protein